MIYQIKEFITEKNLKIDYICPILRSGAIPAVYISNKLNIIKFAPMQVKHIAYKNGENTIEMLFNPFDALKITKEEPVFLLVEALQSTGKSVNICIDEIKKNYPNSKILYVCLVREYGSKDFKEKVEFSTAQVIIEAITIFQKKNVKK